MVMNFMFALALLLGTIAPKLPIVGGKQGPAGTNPLPTKPPGVVVR
ncbi:MAG: hypothetical protein ACHP79_12205 [Terriglobales bacterium]